MSSSADIRKLTNASWRGDIQDVRRILQSHRKLKGSDWLSAQDETGYTALHIAVERGLLEIVNLLIKAGCYVNVVNKVGETALHIAVEEGHLEIVDLLIKKGCEVDVDFLNGKCTLVNAASHGNTELVKCLLKVGCNVNVINNAGETALHMAVEGGHLEIIHLLIKAGCNVNVDFLNGKCTLVNAASHGNTELVKCLLKVGCNVNVINKVGETALHKAVEGGNLEIVHLLIKADSKVNVDFLNDNCTLVNAASHGNTELIKCLLKVGCNLNVINNAGETALHMAVEGGHLEIVHLLIKARCKVDAVNLDGRTALMIASIYNKIEIVKLLISASCNVNVSNKAGETALHMAVEGGHLEIIHLLIKAGCKVNFRDERDRTALHYSAQGSDPAIPLVLLEAGTDLDAQDENGKTFADLANSKLLESVKSHLLSLESRKMVCVIGHPKVGKSTLVKAIRESTEDYWFKGFRNVKDIPNRTAGIDVKTLDDEKYGKMIFFDFAGQSEYYSSHYAFLEAALSSRGTSITFLMVVDLRIPYMERVDQCMEWLSPIQSICSENTSNIRLEIFLIGSHLDTFRKKSEVVDSHATCFQTLKCKLHHHIIEFVDCITMDCRKLASQGLEQLRNYFKGYNWQTLDKHVTKNITSQVSLRACLFWKKVKHHSFTQLKKLVDNLSSTYTLPLIHECCQDLSSAGLALYLPNKETLEDGWLILEIEEVITEIHGKLFAPNTKEFPMHHKDLANKFGLVQSRELDQVFKGSNLSPELIKELLISMEFCHPVDSSLLRDEIRSLLVNQDKWLYFPSLVSQDTPLNPLAPSPSDVQSCVWLCWELRGREYPFLSPRFQHSIFLRLAHKFVQKVKDDKESQILQHSCTVWKNGIFWSTVHEVDFQVQTFSSTATVQVLVRSRNGILPLMKEAPKVIQEVIKMKEHHCPNLKTVSVLVKVKDGIPSGVQAAVSSIVKTVEKGGTAVVPYGSEDITTIPLSAFFYDWSLAQDCVPFFRSMNQFISNVEPCQGQMSAQEIKRSSEIPARNIDWKDLVKKEYEYLKQTLNIQKISDKLWQEDVITGDVKDQIQLPMTTRERANKILLDYIHRDGTLETYKTFVAVLTQTTNIVPIHAEAAKRLEGENVDGRVKRRQSTYDSNTSADTVSMQHMQESPKERTSVKAQGQMRNLEKSEIPTKHICWHNLEVDISPKEKKSINLLLHSSTVENCQERVEVQDLQEGLPVITPVYEEKIPNEVASSSPNEKTLFNEIEDAPGFSNPKKQLEPLKGITNIKEQPYLHHMLTEDIPENIHVDTLLKKIRRVFLLLTTSKSLKCLLSEVSKELQKEVGHPLLPNHDAPDNLDISKFVSAYDIDLLKYIRGRCSAEDEELKATISDLADTFQQLWDDDKAYLSMLPQSTDVLSRMPPLHKLMVLTFPTRPDRLSLSDVLKIKTCVCSVLSLPLHVVFLAGYEEGSVRLQFFIPKESGNELSEDNHLCKIKMHELYIELLREKINVELLCDIYIDIPSEPKVTLWVSSYAETLSEENQHALKKFLEKGFGVSFEIGSGQSSSNSEASHPSNAQIDTVIKEGSEQENIPESARSEDICNQLPNVKVMNAHETSQIAQANDDTDALHKWKESRPSKLAVVYVSESEAVPEWKEVCTHLGVPQKVLTHAEQTFPLGTKGAPASRFKYGLDDWYGGNCKKAGVPVPVTNGMLCKALEECRYCTVSKELFEKELLAAEQDQDLEKVSAGPVTPDHMAHAIKEETEDQNRMSRDMAHNNNIEEKSARVQAVETNLSTGSRCCLVL